MADFIFSLFFPLTLFLSGLSIPGHNPLSTNKLSMRSGYVIAVFRDPRRRALSAFNYHKHSFGMNK